MNNSYPPELQAQIDSLISTFETQKSEAEEVETLTPKFTFSRQTPTREIGSLVKVRNPLDDEPRGGVILSRLGERVYKVRVDETTLIVHEPDDTW